MELKMDANPSGILKIIICLTQHQTPFSIVMLAL
jgi:hypothetical protein